MSKKNMVQQISVYLENKEGTLADLLDYIGSQGINILALSIADTTDFGIVRFVVAPADQASLMEKLDAGDVFARVSDVLGVSIAHEPGSLARVLNILRDADQQVEYAYSIMEGLGAPAAIILQTSDNEACAETLEKAGVKLLTNDDLA